MSVALHASDTPPLGDVQVMVRATPLVSNHIIVWRIERHIDDREEGAPLWAMPDGSFEPGHNPFVVFSSQGFSKAISAVEWAEERGWIVICLVPLP